MVEAGADTSSLPSPAAIVFDWHGTLVNTLDAMYLAIEDMLPRLEALGLFERMVPETEARKLVDREVALESRLVARRPSGFALLAAATAADKKAPRDNSAFKAVVLARSAGAGAKAVATERIETSPCFAPGTSITSC